MPTLRAAARPALALVCLAVAAGWMSAAAHAAAPVGAKRLAASLASFRAAEGLVAAPVGGADQAAADELAERAAGQRPALSRSGYGTGYLCYLCAPAGLAGPEGSVLVETLSVAGWDVGRTMRSVTGAAGLLLDPRLVALSAAETPDGVIALVGRMDTTRPARRPVVWPRRTDAEEAGRILFVAPAGTPGRVVLDGPGGRLVSGRDFTLVRTGATTFSASPGDPPPLALGARYRVRVGGLPAGVLAVRGVPAGTPRLIGLGARRRVILGAIRRSPAPVRRIWSRLGSRLEVTRGNGTCPQLTSCTDTTARGFRISLSAQHLARPADEIAFTLIHELGHVVERSGFTDATRSAISRTMRSGGRWRCVVDPSSIDPDTPRSEWCLSDEEQWADDFARYATGDPHPGGAYGRAALLGPATLVRFLNTRWAPRLPSAAGGGWSGPGRPRAG